MERQVAVSVGQENDAKETDLDDRLQAVLDNFGFTQTGNAWVENGGLYATRTENSDQRYLGSVQDAASCRRVIDAWFEVNGASLPE